MARKTTVKRYGRKEKKKCQQKNGQTPFVLKAKSLLKYLEHKLLVVAMKLVPITEGEKFKGH